MSRGLRSGLGIDAVANIGRTNFLNRFKVDGNKLRGNFSLQLARAVTSSPLLPPSTLLNFMKTWQRNFNLGRRKKKIKLPFNDITKTQPQRSF